jgi:hypothetical protein
MDREDTAASLADRTYLIDAYSKLGILERRARERDQAEALQDALVLLCETLTQLLDDQRFWADVIELLRSDPEERLPEVLGGFDELLDVQADELKGLGYDDDLIDELLADAGIASESLAAGPSGASYQNLQTRLRKLRDAVCGLTTNRTDDRRKWRRRGLKLVRRGGYVLAGGSIVVLDSKASLIHGHPGWWKRSVDLGVRVMGH